MQLPDKWRLAISKFILDCAEKVPVCEAGLIAKLQEIRKHQRRDSTKAHQKSRFPGGVEIELSYVRIAEVFLLEHAHELKKGLTKLFPTIRNQTFNSGMEGEISKFATGLSGGGWKTLGTIMRQNIAGMPKGAFIFRVIPELPLEVDYISVELHKCLSSSTFLTFDIFLTTEAKANLIVLHNRRYIADFKFGNLNPFRLLAGGSSEDSVYSKVPEAIAEWQSNLRKGVEVVLRQFFQGIFLNSGNAGKAQLPAVEIFLLKGVPAIPVDFNKWINAHLGWWTSMGFNFPREIFCDEHRAYIWPDTRKSCHKPVHRFITRSNEGIEAVHTKEVLSGLMAALTLLEILTISEKNIERLREKTVRKTHRLKTTVKLNEQIQNQAMMLERIITEFNQNKMWIEYKLSAVDQYKCLNNSVNKNLRQLMV